jgi:nucleoside-diphosphate-sugar epimerase
LENLIVSRVLIAGCGYVGSALADRLIEAGHEVWGLRRSAARLPQGVKPIYANLNDLDSLEGLPSPLDYVVYSAGASGFDEAAYRRVYVDGAVKLLEAMRRQGIAPKRFLYTSSTGVYAQQDGSWVDENSPTKPTNFSGEILLEGEAVVLETEFSSVIVRLGGIYGPGRTRLVDAVRDGSARINEGTPQYLNLNHRDDCAAALEHLMTLEKADSIYLTVDSYPVDRSELLRWTAERMGLPEPETIPATTTPRGRQGGNKRCKNDRLLATGFQHAYPSFKEGYAPILEPSEA